jgi:hypothetical protein
MAEKYFKGEGVTAEKELSGETDKKILYIYRSVYRVWFSEEES